jgi:hypothetical protein
MSIARMVSAVAATCILVVPQVIWGACSTTLVLRCDSCTSQNYNICTGPCQFTLGQKAVPGDSIMGGGFVGCLEAPPSVTRCSSCGATCSIPLDVTARTHCSASGEEDTYTVQLCCNTWE